MSEKRGLGGRSTWYAEQVSAKFVPFGYGDWALYTEREVTLSEDLAEISDRSLRWFRLIGTDTDLRMSREMAVWLHGALNTALTETEGETEVER